MAGVLNLGEVVDPTSHSRTGAAVTIPTSELTTHGVIVGMTGSGKTGLGVVLLEEVLSAGVGTIVIDPKGDLANLCLLFPGLSAPEFRPWVNDSDAAKAGVDLDTFAAQQAQTWKDGLASWGIGPERIIELGTKAAFTIYTPGSSTGVGLNLIGSLQAPVGVDAETTADEIEGFVTGLLGLVDIDADPLASREHILLSNLIAHAWGKGQSLDLAQLVGMVASPPIRKLGVFDLDTFFPPADRTKLAMSLNGLLASPSFAAWGQGIPLDIGALLATPEGKPRCAIVSIAHLSDPERQFVVALLLGKLVTWMRRQSGTSDLRALVYMDEVAGYVPPTAAPPTKKPILTLFKQARAFGVGMVLATQNPVDVDYKAISNAGTWMIGRLQTEQDKARIIEGLSSATGGVDVSVVSDQISNLAKREFVLRRASQNAPSVFTSRWAMSYLRGPVTREQVADLMADQKAAMPEPSVAPVSSPAHADAASSVAPVVATGMAVRYVDPAAPWLAAVGADPDGTVLTAAAVARVNLVFDDEKAALREQVEYECVITPLGEVFDPANVIAVDYDDRDLRTDAPTAASYETPEAKIANKTYWSQLTKDLTDHLVRSQHVTVLRNAELKMYARPGETPESFTNRCKEAAETKADAETAALRDKYETKLDKAADQIEQAEQRLEIAQSEAKNRKRGSFLSAAGSLLGGLLGGRKSSKAMASAAARAATGLAKGQGSTATAKERVEAASIRVEQESAELQALENELAEELVEIDQRWQAAAAGITELEVPLERSDVKVTQVVLAWLPR